MLEGIRTQVLPACAGVILTAECILNDLEGFTRMRGGDPTNRRFIGIELEFYPHARG